MLFDTLKFWALEMSMLPLQQLKIKEADTQFCTLSSLEENSISHQEGKREKKNIIKLLYCVEKNKGRTKLKTGVLSNVHAQAWVGIP